MDEVFPVGNTHLAYYEEVMDHFEEQGFEAGDSHVLVAGGELVAWYLKDRYPGAHVESIDIDERSIEHQRDFATRLEAGEDPDRMMKELQEGRILDLGEEMGTVYPEVLQELDGRVKEPDESRVQDFDDYRGEPDMIVSNNVCDYATGFMETVNRAEPDFLEFYTVLPVEYTVSSYEGDLEAQVNPGVDFWWVPSEMGSEADVVLYSPSN